MTPEAMQIEHVPVAELVPYVNNARRHPEEQIRALVRSIRAYGFNNPVLIDAAGHIVAGHGRVEAAKRLGMDVVPCIRLRHLTEEQRRAFIIADNRVSELGTWDAALLAREVEDLLNSDELDLDPGDLGFDDEAIAGLIGDLGKDLDDAPDPDAPLTRKEARKAAKTKAQEPTADDMADIGQGATNPAEGKGLLYPVILQLDRATWKRWRQYRGKRTDTEAISALLDLADHHVIAAAGGKENRE